MGRGLVTAVGLRRGRTISRAGVHVLTLSARDAAGRTIAQRLRVRLRR